MISIKLIAAISQNGCIGQNNKLPWHIPEDLKHFKELTAGKIVLMGRTTFESILGYLGKPLPNRTNIVITHQHHYAVPAGVEVFTSIDEALRAHPNDDIMVIGGAQIYAQTIDLADTLYLTEVHQTVMGDAFFPTIENTKWKETAREQHEGFDFVTYQKISF